MPRLRKLFLKGNQVTGSVNNLENLILNDLIPQNQFNIKNLRTSDNQFSVLQNASPPISVNASAAISGSSAIAKPKGRAIAIACLVVLIIVVYTILRIYHSFQRVGANQMSDIKDLHVSREFYREFKEEESSLLMLREEEKMLEVERGNVLFIILFPLTLIDALLNIKQCGVEMIWFCYVVTILLILFTVLIMALMIYPIVECERDLKMRYVMAQRSLHSFVDEMTKKPSQTPGLLTKSQSWSGAETRTKSWNGESLLAPAEYIPTTIEISRSHIVSLLKKRPESTFIVYTRLFFRMFTYLGIIQMAMSALVKSFG
ncbi:hypothetical protein Leryth_006330 [Lithospermum erythrorhizon]|nr:hypothetical protein Leryth_006330 [Lithospermum erythrorhizon]